MIHILYPSFGRHPHKGYIDIRWKYSGIQGFLVAFGPISHHSFFRAVEWFFGKRRQRGLSVIRRNIVKTD